MTLVEVAITLGLVSIVALGVTAVSQNLAVGVRSAGASGELQSLFAHADLLLSDPQRCASVLRNGADVARFNGGAEQDAIQGKNVDRMVFPSSDLSVRELIKEGNTYSGHELALLRFIRKSPQLETGVGNPRYLAALRLEFKRNGVGIGTPVKSREILMELEVEEGAGPRPVLHCKLSSRTEEQLCSDMGGTWNRDFSPKCLLDTYFGIARTNSERAASKAALPNGRGLAVQGAARIESLPLDAHHARLDLVRAPGTHTGSAELAVVNRSNSNSRDDHTRVQILRENGEGDAELLVHRTNGGSGNAELRVLKGGADGAGLAHLSVQSNGNSYIDASAHSVNKVGYFRVQRSLGSADSPVNLPNGVDSQLGWFAGTAYVGGAFREVARIGFRLEGKDAGALGKDNYPGAIVFRVRPQNDISKDGVVGMYLNPQGNLQVLGAITGLTPGSGPKIGAGARAGDVLTAADASGTSQWKGFKTWTRPRMLMHTTSSTCEITPSEVDHNDFVHRGSGKRVGGPWARKNLSDESGKTLLMCSLSLQRHDTGLGIGAQHPAGGATCFVERESDGDWILVADSWNGKFPGPYTATPERFPRNLAPAEAGSATGDEGACVQCNATCLYLE